MAKITQKVPTTQAPTGGVQKNISDFSIYGTIGRLDYIFRVR